MQVEKKELENSAIQLVIKIEPDEFKPYEKAAFVKLSSNLKVKGFRQGKECRHPLCETVPLNR